jgi:ATP-dependent helicase/nuclease subunit A
MSAAPDSLIKDEVERAQRRAAHPATSIWVAASAGSGKTKVLTDRALALMLAGTPPHRLLCLTFTKAAAAEMANRLAQRLSLWAAADDEGLGKGLFELTGRAAEEDDLHRARRLFAQVLECPGGMKIQTIHAFCQSLLRRFPLEAGIPPYFEPLDERSAAEQMLAAREAVLAEARAGRAPAVAAALGTVTALVGEAEFGELLQALAAERGRVAAAMAAGPAALARRLRRRLGVAPGATAAALLEAGVADAALDLLGLRYCVAALGQGSEAERARAETIARWLERPERRVAGFADYCACFHARTTGQILARLVTAATVRGAPGVDTILQAEAERLLQLRERWRAAILAEATEALLTIADAVLQAYGRQKQRRAQLDYDDLILLTRDLLAAPGVAPWVLFKLDGGLDHILIDEAQDTSPEQWEVVRRLAEEFFAGEGARPQPRTLFVVGDVKQSIFSFQGADPAAFGRMRDHFNARALAARQGWDDVPLTISFRSTAAVLTAVDRVFARAAASDGVALDGGPIAHRPFRVGAPGLVELWPPAVPLDEAEPAAWASPTRRVSADSPRARLARLIAARIAAMVGREPLPSRERLIHAGDVMVLVRRRNGFVDELIRELKQRGVAVAGIDRMVLTDQLAVMDLMAVGQFLLQPGDDLTLAALLKSPLVGLAEEALFDLAHHRGPGAGLWQALGERREEPAFAAAHALLAGLLARADQVRPYELFADLLGRGGGRRRLLGRLGPDAADPIEEFLNLALQHERSHVPSLQSFLAWLAAGGVEIKRDLEQETGGQVRVLTVHGAKGLQAPIVFLPDTMAAPQLPARLMWTAEGLPLWSPRVDHDEAVAAGARQAHKAAVAREYRRLLYVAMTRAEDRLYVCGWQGAKAAAADCWYRLVAEGLAGSGATFAFDSGPELGPRDGWQGEGIRIAEPPPRPFAVPAAAAAEGDAAVPGWLGRPPPPEPSPPRPLVPSRPAAAEPAVRPPLAAGRGAAFQRGRLVHRLLELLPDLPAPQRAAACRRWLAQPGHGLAPAEQAVLAAEIMALLEDPACAALFGPGSRAEVPVIGRLAGPEGGVLVLSGRIDRLLVERERVLIVDYKTNRPPPRRAADVPALYLQQMAAYRAALAGIYPGRRIECALLWTDGPRLMALPEGLLAGFVPAG